MTRKNDKNSWLVDFQSEGPLSALQKMSIFAEFTRGGQHYAYFDQGAPFYIHDQRTVISVRRLTSDMIGRTQGH